MALNGGSLSLYDSRNIENNIQNSSFEKNQALASGGCVFLKNSTIQLMSNYFKENRAAIGGVLRYTEFNP